MNEPIFKLQQKKYLGETAVVSVRLPKEMLADIDKAASVSGRTRNEIMSMSLEFALHHMEIIAPEPENNEK